MTLHHLHQCGYTAAAIAALALTACSSEENSLNPEINDPGLIRFSAVAPHTSRADVTTTATIDKFSVTAYSGGKKIMDNVDVTREGSAWKYSPAAYWPNTPVNFYAVSPNIAGSPDITGGGTGTASIKGFKNPGDVDLLYAVNYNEVQSGAPVLLNFRHALAKVEVLLSTTNEALQIKVHSLELGSVCTLASFFYPRATTSAGNDVAGIWHDATEPEEIPLFTCPGTGTPHTLNAVPTLLSEDKSYGSDATFYIPQELPRLAYDESTQGFTGAYIALDCEIFDAATGNKLFPSKTTPDYLLADNGAHGRILYPLTSSTVSEWKAGYTYRYNITINNPAVLFDDIEFDVTVDEFIQGGPSETPGV